MPRPGGAKASALPDTDLNPRRDPPLDFADREMSELTPTDYHELGFMCGLEVHQQLDTQGKLFCRCPAGLRTDRVDAEVLRHMRPTLSEMGEYDGCALMEFKTRKQITYQLDHRSVCTYEMDDTPPFPIDEEAVRTAILVSRLFGLQLVSELQVMRKQYLDGSIPTGFQRTAMVGIGGVIPFRTSELGADRELRIRQLTLEEDSCREVSDIGHRVTFNTDRLGTPLIETVTEPDLLTPRDAAAGGRLLAEVARVSECVRRGAGAARQDVNVSIAGSRRVEIKGVSSHAAMPLLVHNEAFRHLNLLRIQHELGRRGVDETALRSDGLQADVTDLLRGTRDTPIAAALDRGERVRAVCLPGFGGLLAHRTQPGLTFAQEFHERVRVIACLTGSPFTLCRDLHLEELGEASWNEVAKAVRAGRDDSLVLVWGDPQDLATAAGEVLLRGIDALHGVPSETRQARWDGTTGFERILPGPERMYPDTDTPPLPIPDAWVERFDSRSWEMPWQREDRYVASGLSATVAQRLSSAPWAVLFDELAPEGPEVVRRFAHALESRMPHYWRESGHRELPAVVRLRPLVRAMESGRVKLAGVSWILDQLLRSEATAEEILSAHAAEDGGDREVAERIQSVAAESANGRGFSSEDAKWRWAMGTVLRGLPRGKLEPASIREELARSFEESSP